MGVTEGPPSKLSERGIDLGGQRSSLGRRIRSQHGRFACGYACITHGFPVLQTLQQGPTGLSQPWTNKNATSRESRRNRRVVRIRPPRSQSLVRLRLSSRRGYACRTGVSQGPSNLN